MLRALSTTQEELRKSRDKKRNIVIEDVKCEIVVSDEQIESNCRVIEPMKEFTLELGPKDIAIRQHGAQWVRALNREANDFKYCILKREHVVKPLDEFRHGECLTQTHRPGDGSISRPDGGREELLTQCRKQHAGSGCTEEKGVREGPGIPCGIHGVANKHLKPAAEKSRGRLG